MKKLQINIVPLSPSTFKNIFASQDRLIRVDDKVRSALCDILKLNLSIERKHHSYTYNCSMWNNRTFKKVDVIRFFALLFKTGCLKVHFIKKVQLEEISRIASFPVVYHIDQTLELYSKYIFYDDGGCKLEKTELILVDGVCTKHDDVFLTKLQGWYRVLEDVFIHHDIYDYVRIIMSYEQLESLMNQWKK